MSENPSSTSEGLGDLRHVNNPSGPRFPPVQDGRVTAPKAQGPDPEATPRECCYVGPARTAPHKRGGPEKLTSLPLHHLQPGGGGGRRGREGEREMGLAGQERSWGLGCLRQRPHNKAPLAVSPQKAAPLFSHSPARKQTGKEIPGCQHLSQACLGGAKVPLPQGT